MYSQGNLGHHNRILVSKAYFDLFLELAPPSEHGIAKCLNY